MNYRTKGVCSREITFEVNDNKLTNVQFIGGCSGSGCGWNGEYCGCAIVCPCPFIAISLAHGEG